MTASLASQLAQTASLNAGILIDRSRRKVVESYLFTGREADHHDLEAIHALARNGLLQLSALNHSLGQYESSLFSDAVKGLDRTLIGKTTCAELDRNIDGFLAMLGPHLLKPATGKVLEWLVRRFRYVWIISRVQIGIARCPVRSIHAAPCALKFGPFAE
jgi:U3 small nucleolar RNA-associated protein 10